MPNGLENQFHDAMQNIYERARDECGYTATRFLQMLNEHGGLETARRLLHDTRIPDGFISLWELHRLDLTVEALVLKEPWRQLFTQDELNIAWDRLNQSEYNFQE